MKAENGERCGDNERCGVIVLGMHRGGTSLVSHLLGEMGLSHGGELMEAKFDNPLGYWEHAGVVDVHNDFLADLGRDWQDPRALEAADFASPAAQRARRRLRGIFETDFAPQGHWVLKDPRHCRLLPLWNEIFDERRAEIRFLHVLRHPRAVARSLAARNDTTPAHAELLWLRHELESERFTRSWQRAWLDFESLAEDPATAFAGGCEKLGLAELLAAAGDGIYQRVLDPSHIHHRERTGGASSTADLHPWVRRSWEAFCGLVESGAAEHEARLDAVAAEMQSNKRIYEDGLAAPLGKRLATAEKESTALRSQLDETTRYAQQVEETLAEKSRYAESLESVLAERDQLIAAKDRQSAEAAAYTRDLEQRFAALHR